MMKPIPSALGYYAHLPTGRIFSNRSGFMKPLAGGKNEHGYLHVTIRKYGGQTTRRINRLVAEAAYGPCPVGHECAHLNADRTDNRASNLAWVTPSENNGKLKVDAGRIVRGSQHHQARLDEDAVRRIRSEKRCYGYVRRLAEHYGVSSGTIHNVRSGRAWGHVV